MLLLLQAGALIDAAASPSTAKPAGGTGAVPKVDVSGLPILTIWMTVVGSMFFGTIGGTANVSGNSALALLGLSDANARFSLFAPMIALLVPVLIVGIWLAWRMAPVYSSRLPVRILQAVVAGIMA